MDCYVMLCCVVLSYLVLFYVLYVCVYLFIYIYMWIYNQPKMHFLEAEIDDVAGDPRGL